MKRNAKEIARLIRVQRTVADLARLEHRAAITAASEKTAEIEALERWAEGLQAHALPLLEVSIERTRTLSAERVELDRTEAVARERLIGETARCRPLARAYRQARQAEERSEHEAQLGEMIDRQFSVSNQASRKARGS